MRYVQKVERIFERRAERERTIWWWLGWFKGWNGGVIGSKSLNEI